MPGARLRGRAPPSHLILVLGGLSILAAVMSVHYSTSTQIMHQMNLHQHLDLGIGGTPPIDPHHSQRYEYERMELSISSDAHSLGKVAPEYISTTLDWWKDGTEGWGNSSVLNADLTHPKLISAARGLSPYFLRIGGSQADEIVYNFPSNNANDDITAQVTKQCKKKPHKCLTKERWEEVLNFARSTGARIVFTLAYVRHTRDDEGNNDKRDWDWRNARQFIEYNTFNTSHAQMGTVFGYELGNELRHKGKIKNVTRIARAYKELRQIIDEIWDVNDRKQYHKPVLLGPASTGKGETTKLVAELGPLLDHVSYHKYHAGGKDTKLKGRARHPSFYLHPLSLSGPGEAVIKHQSNGFTQLWIGEGAMAYNSGRLEVTDSFVGALWFSNLLGALSKTQPVPHSVYCRQALTGGYYELVSHETLQPNPDYWVAYIWKTVIGTKAIGPIQSPQRVDTMQFSSKFTFGCCVHPGKDSILIHSYCAKHLQGDVVFVVINISESMAIKLNVNMGNDRTEYLLSPNEDGYQSKEVFVNGKRMHVENDGNISTMQGIRRGRNDEAVIPPISIAFIVVHGAEVKECI